MEHQAPAPSEPSHPDCTHGHRCARRVRIGILQRVVDDEICWDEVCISFRPRFRENPTFFNQDFWAMLYNSSPAFLDEYLHHPNPKFS